jgi:dihydropyrimidine dehydrogenase (NAD+) subunit PreA
MAVGAGVVEFCTVVMHYGFRVIDDLKSGMSHYLDEMGFPSPAVIVGKALPNIVTHDDLERKQIRSHINEKLCIACDLCYVACRDGGHMAIDQQPNRVPQVDWDRCVGCGLCQHVCPVESCIEMHIMA